MNPILESFLSLLIPAVILLHLAWAPYTKVEESFNIQAVHDILVHGIPTENASEFLAQHYDHVSFPGSVPRTFSGALVLAGLSRPFVPWLSSPPQVQLLVRAILGLLNAFALLSFRRVVWKVFGKAASNWFVLFQATQFHLMFYASRTLPNMFAFAMSTFALSFYLKSLTNPNWLFSAKQLRLCFYLLTIAGIVFRSELAILLGCLVLHQLLQRVPSTGLLPFLRFVIPSGIAGAVIGLLITVPIDTFFWRTYPNPLWPEWSAFAFNTLHGHASDWGTSPFHYYFLSALPKLLMNPLTYTILIPLSVLNAATRGPCTALLAPCLSFVAIYSLLPHKEWRFIIYVVPALTACAAASAGWISTRYTKAAAYRVATWALLASVALSAAASAALLAISAQNYPGGAALVTLHNRVAVDEFFGGAPLAPRFSVHLDNLACQTGVTHFLEKGGPRLLQHASSSDDDSGKKHQRDGEWALRADGGIDWIPYSDEEKAQKAKEASLSSSERWVYDKTDDPDALLDPAFWNRFEFALMERPEKAIGKWEVVDVIYGFGGIKIVRPGEVLGTVLGGVEEGLGPRSESLRRLVLGVDERKTGWVWGALEDWVREKVMRGWWVGVRMEPKIRILKRLPVV
ncbi:GPI mannosyltransferase [Lasiodiplodia theobromae]|uniref:Mannosyltransferase n=1 Tax=Lasiodiplodia theobromae TaxID=45133 RepID=A0A5N5DIN6_9PEZI|nr:Dol-P-Man:Man(7)GlcNAc(2)-PP-Dol alpha-1,6-mannosyltransferase [Lasiodiplodia theobromae]KAF9633669.1 GPI mannosyltransferase [Lasiodiplodia theobromae]